MKAIQYYGPTEIKYEEVMVKPPEEGEVVVKVMAALTCGTDVKTFRRGHPVLIKEVPSGFGHEFSGIVEKVGRGVTEFKVGDRVVAANSAPCGECFFCKRGEYNLCEKLEFLKYLSPFEYINSKTIVTDNCLNSYNLILLTIYIIVCLIGLYKTYNKKELGL
jgi:L-iditol 2-dehydrogenase